MWLTDQFRYGLDADMVHLWATRTPVWFVRGIFEIGVFGTPFLILAYWVVRLRGLGRGWFFAIASIVPAAPVLGLGLYFALEEILQPTRGVTPYEASSLTYLPNYLAPVSITAAMWAAAFIYLRIAIALSGPGPGQILSQR